MFDARFIGGEKVPSDYLARISRLIRGACDAEEQFDIDALEAFATRTPDAGPRQGAVVPAEKERGES